MKLSAAGARSHKCLAYRSFITLYQWLSSRGDRASQWTLSNNWRRVWEKADSRSRKRDSPVGEIDPTTVAGEGKKVD